LHRLRQTVYTLQSSGHGFHFSYLRHRGKRLFGLLVCWQLPFISRPLRSSAQRAQRKANLFLKIVERTIF
jgi:hypothetical protein